MIFISIFKIIYIHIHIYILNYVYIIYVYLLIFRMYDDENLTLWNA
jgi:hypothetical protein